MRMLLVAIMAVLSVLVMPAQQAHACSCAMMDTQEMMAISDNGFIGTLVERDDGFLGGDESDFRFEVEQWLGEDFGASVTVRSASNGAACGLEIPVGNRAAVFLNRSGNGWHGSLCSTMPAEVVLAALAPFVATSQEAAFALVWGGSGDRSIILIDNFGDPIASADTHQAWVRYVSACPGDERVLSFEGHDAVIRSLPSLDVVDRYNIGEVRIGWCRSVDGYEWVALTSGAAGSQLVGSVGSTVSIIGESYTAEMVGEVVYVVENNQRDIVAYDLTTGTRAVVHVVDGRVSNWGGIQSLARNGTRIAFQTATYLEDQTFSEVGIIDTTSREVTNVVGMPYDVSIVQWLGANELLIASGEEEFAWRIMDATTLEAGRLIEGTWYQSAPTANGAVVVDQGTLLTIGSNGAIPVATYPNAALFNVTVLDPTVDVVAPQPDPAVIPTTPDAEPAPQTSGPPLDSASPESGTPSTFPRTAAAVALFLVAATSLFVIGRRRTID